MKKLVLMLLLFSFGLFLLACSDTTEEATRHVRRITHSECHG
jgi:hypothetical protein